MGLKEYAQKRHFNQTPEPPPSQSVGKGSTEGGFFCVQRHDATRLHYDFRLEVDGVLVSWAVPKGPSLDPSRKALAMKVEDHPLEYGTFEGNIPEGNYGAGSVMLWDKGTYEVIGDEPASKQIERGDFKFVLHGVKLNGAFAIVHMKHAGKGNEWLLIKKKDEFVVADYDIDQFAWSIATERSQQEIAENKPAAKTVDVSRIAGARRAAMPASIEPMLAKAVGEPPSGEQWIYEIKWDGIRALCRLSNGTVEIHSRRGNHCESQYPEFLDVARHVSAKDVWLDGEICVLDEEGRSSFELLQHRITASPKTTKGLLETHPATLFLFDVLYVDGYDLRGASFENRRQILISLVSPGENIRISDIYDTDGDRMMEAARSMNLEGVLAKDRRSKYESGRSSKWQKIKTTNDDEFVIAGWTKGERDYFGSLVLGEYCDGTLHHVGQVGTGFDTKQMKVIHDRMKPLITKTCPFSKKPKIKDVTWLRPELLCRVKFLERTTDGMLRAPVFEGLRDDKVAEELAPESDVAVQPDEDSQETQVPAQPGPKLDLRGREATAEIDGHVLKFSNLQKVFFPREGWKKRDLIEFYDRVSRFLLPHLKDRPLSLKRYPNGIADEYFFQKNASSHFPEWMRCEPIREGQGRKTNHYPFAQDRASLLYLVNLGCIDQNPWMSRIDNLEHPDWMLLDLDPVEAGYDQIVDAVLLIREVLKELGLQGYPKTTGGDGMHVYVPLEPVYTYEQVRNFAELLSQLVIDREPKLFTTPRSVNKREKGRVYFDYLQIGTGKTIAAPYVVRAYDGAPVATPLVWSEVKRGIKPEDFRIDNVMERFEKLGDIFAPVLQGGQRIEDALERLQSGPAPKNEDHVAPVAAKPSPRPKKTGGSKHATKRVKKA